MVHSHAHAHACCADREAKGIGEATDRPSVQAQDALTFKVHGLDGRHGDHAKANTRPRMEPASGAPSSSLGWRKMPVRNKPNTIIMAPLTMLASCR